MEHVITALARANIFALTNEETQTTAPTVLGPKDQQTQTDFAIRALGIEVPSSIRVVLRKKAVVASGALHG